MLKPEVVLPAGNPLGSVVTEGSETDLWGGINQPNQAVLLVLSVSFPCATPCCCFCLAVWEATGRSDGSALDSAEASGMGLNQHRHLSAANLPRGAGRRGLQQHLHPWSVTGGGGGGGGSRGAALGVGVAPRSAGGGWGRGRRRSSPRLGAGRRRAEGMCPPDAVWGKCNGPRFLRA